jgi:hypothetical protein
MHAQLSFFLIAVLISAGTPAALAKSDYTVSLFTLQVASFSDTVQAERFAVMLARAGEDPVFDTVKIDGRGLWTRVSVGLFNTADAARRHGVTLVARGIIEGFLVKKADSVLALTRPRRVVSSEPRVSNLTDTSGLSAKPKRVMDTTGSRSLTNNGRAPGVRVEKRTVNNGYGFTQGRIDPARALLPVVELAGFRLVPRVDTNLIPRPDPVSLAFKLITGELRNTPAAKQRGGLWISGDTAEGLARLRWIVGHKNAGLIKLDSDGRVRFDVKRLAEAAGRGETRVQDPLKVVDHVSSNEGLLLLVQVTQGRYRYLLHIGRQAPTYGKSVDTAGSINLDNNVDSRINPYRKNGKKLDAERPPEGFDSLIALNPVARWFNLNTNGWVPGGEIVFHELAEAYAKLEFGLDYLDQGSHPGAHAVALAREQRLKSQRPSADIVITTGSNRLLRTHEEIRLFTAEASAGVNQR